jgi:hypothetical protein
MLVGSLQAPEGQLAAMQPLVPAQVQNTFMRGLVIGHGYPQANDFNMQVLTINHPLPASDLRSPC